MNDELPRNPKKPFDGIDRIHWIKLTATTAAVESGARRKWIARGVNGVGKD